MNAYFYELAQQSADIANSYGCGDNNIQAEWIYAQWAHETGNFTSAMCVDYYNLGGLTQSRPNDTPQPDGAMYYMQFLSYEAYAEYFGRYLRYYAEDGIYAAHSLYEYVSALRIGGYFGDSLENYFVGTKRIYLENFA